MQQFNVYYNNAFMIMHGLSMRCCARLMFVSSGIDCCNSNFFNVCTIKCTGYLLVRTTLFRA